jgi:hypothetical protein
MDNYVKIFSGSFYDVETDITKWLASDGAIKVNHVTQSSWGSDGIVVTVFFEII